MAWSVFPSDQELALLGEAGIIYRESRQFQEAREVFLGLQALAPKSEVPEVLLGTVCCAEGLFSRAMEHYSKALILNPRSAYAYVQMAEASLFQKDWAGAKAHSAKALELDRQGEYGQFARSLRTLQNELPQNATAE